MSKFTPLVKFTTSFEEDEISMQLRRLKRRAMMKLTPFLTSGKDGELNEMEMMEVATDMLPDHVVDFKGLKNEDGEAITLEAMLDEAYFMILIAEIIQKIFSISKMTEEDQVNSEGQPGISASVMELSEEKQSPTTPVRIGSESLSHAATEPSNGAGPMEDVSMSKTS